MILIFISSSIPMDREIKGIEFVMKIDPKLQDLLHIPVFALLAFLWFRCFCHGTCGVKQMLGLSILITLLFGILTECYQIIIPGRYFSLNDVLFNLIGTTAGVVAGATFQ